MNTVSLEFTAKDGTVYTDIEDARNAYCRGRVCNTCPMSFRVKDYKDYLPEFDKHECTLFVNAFPAIAARVMGLEVAYKRHWILGGKDAACPICSKEVSGVITNKTECPRCGFQDGDIITQNHINRLIEAMREKEE